MVVAVALLVLAALVLCAQPRVGRVPRRHGVERIVLGPDDLLLRHRVFTTFGIVFSLVFESWASSSG
jgi:hypothetical protein